MTTLLILRHGKAEQTDTGLDHERELTKRGKRDAKTMGELLRQSSLVPDRIISSSATRARETAERVAAAAAFRGVIDVLPELYLAEPEAYVTALKRLSGGAERVLVVGHNPGLEALALRLTAEPVSLPTAGLLVLHLPILDFAALSLNVKSKLVRSERPRAE